MSAMKIDIAPDGATVAQRAAEFVCAAAEAKKGLFAMCLSGGNTPKALYEILAREPLASRMPWSRIHFFIGDERFVPPDDPRSNFRMIRESLFAASPTPPEQIHPIPTLGLSLGAAADAYERTLKTFYGAESLTPQRLLFDLVLLGLGPDGHTASLLPGRPELNVTDRWAVPVPAGAPEPRITLALPALNASDSAVFLVVGAEKRGAFSKLRGKDPATPAARIEPAGELMAFVDKLACE